jgi:hypothetical protein
MNDEDFRKNVYTALLFDAADLLERRAARCIPGPWVVDGRDVVPKSDSWGEVATCRESSHDEADWIAMMDPSITPQFATMLRDQGRELYLNIVSAGDTRATRWFIDDSYGDLLVLAWKLCGRPDLPWLTDIINLRES